MHLSEELELRGFIHQFSAPTLAEIVDGEKRTIYHGIDPTADSAHAGNFVNWMLLRHLVSAGHKVLFLVGGGTGMIGDPKPDSERQLKTIEDIEKNVSKIRAQAEAFFADVPGEIEFVNNHEWLGSLKLVDFLRDIGKHFTVNELIKKDAIATRLQGDTGLSYTEFAYPLLQSFDYLQLYREKNCTVQIGGSDQWGNIVGGVDLIRRKEQAEVYAITIPLVIDKATGKKFGKSEGNAIWLDAEQTSPYQFYQFWLNVSDESVIDYLKLFTFLSLAEIEELKHQFEVNPGERKAQKTLAYEVTKIVHGEENSIASRNVSDILFSDEGSVTIFSEVEKELLFKNAPSSESSIGTNIVDVVIENELAKSKREARTFIESGAITLNGEKITSLEYILSEADFSQGFLLLKRGKKQLRVVRLK